ncbi:MAG: hypothetical protein K2X97_04230 [Mycobacteriaceae bacterium]|nr:hypothetical protein [Mycobacteriaceae bacterium]
MPAEVMDAFRQADRTGIYHATRMMLKRPDIHHRLPTTTTKAGRRTRRAACATMRNARADVVRGGGRVAPLLVDAQTIARRLVDFWEAAPPAAPRH